VTVAAWRITRAEFAGSAFTGEGAARFPGRWNAAGMPVVYLSGNLSLAVLEILVHIESVEALERFVCIPVEFAAAEVTRVDAARLPGGWRAFPASESTRRLGADWHRGGSSVVLGVPSAVIPEERNYLVNPGHPHFARIRPGVARPLPFDSRLLKHLPG